MKCLRGLCIAAGIVPRMHDLSLAILIADFFSHDPFRALGLMGLACVAISMTTDFDLLHLLGFVDVSEEADRESSIA
jgi:hypothetical protein